MGLLGWHLGKKAGHEGGVCSSKDQVESIKTKWKFPFLFLIDLKVVTGQWKELASFTAQPCTHLAPDLEKLVEL